MMAAWETSPKEPLGTRLKIIQNKRLDIYSTSTLLKLTCVQFITF